jgi:hypothetical protein
MSSGTSLRYPSVAREDSQHEADPHKRDVVPFVNASKTTVPYTLSPEQVEDVCARTEHARGNVQSDVATSVRLIVNWNPNFAFEHVFHHAAESLGHVPTYQEYPSVLLGGYTGAAAS